MSGTADVPTPEAPIRAETGSDDIRRALEIPAARVASPA